MVIGTILVRRTWRRVHVACLSSALLIGTAANAGPLTQTGVNADLESLVLRSSVFSDEPVTLIHGEYRAPAAPGSASEVIIRLTDKRVFGVLDGKPTGALIVATSTGGTGTFYELALLLKAARA